MINKSSHIASSCHAYDMFCFWVNWFFRHFLRSKWGDNRINRMWMWLTSFYPSLNNIQSRECTSRAHRFKMWSERLSRDSCLKVTTEATKWWWGYGKKNFWSAAQYMMDMKQEISETSFLKQVNLFLHRLCPLRSSVRSVQILLFMTGYQIDCNAL